MTRRQTRQIARRENMTTTLMADVANGLKERLGPLLLHLSEEILFVPVRGIDDLSGTREEKRIRLVSYSDDGKKFVPAFTSEEYLLDWAAGENYECVPLLGADLALSLAEGSWIALDAGQRVSVELAPHFVVMLGKVGLEPGFDLLQHVADAPAYSEKLEGGAGSGDEQPTESEESFEEEEKEKENCSRALVEEISAELSAHFRDFPEVLEAYLLEAESEHSRLLLGLLMGEIDTERRFLLIDGVACISRKHFGTACAIEVYDDSAAETCGSWELFNTLAPFYLSNSVEARPGTAVDAGVGGSLRERIERIVEPSKSRAPLQKNGHAAKGLRKRRIFGPFGGAPVGSRE